MKAVVHIGVSKAGSTTIQETTFAHRAALLKCGVLVPTQDGRFIRPIDLANAVTGKSSTSRSEEVRSVIEDGISRHRPQASSFRASISTTNEVQPRRWKRS